MSLLPGSERPTNMRFAVLAVLSSLAFITYLDRICISQVSEEIAKDLHFSAWIEEDQQRFEAGADTNYKEILKAIDRRELKEKLEDPESRREKAKERISKDRKNSRLSWIFSAFLLGYLLLEIPAGFQGDVWGPRLVIFRIVVWWSIFTALTGSADKITSWFTAPSAPAVGTVVLVLVLIRFLFGAGEAGAYPNITRVLSRWFAKGDRAGPQGVIWFSSRLGGAVAPLVIVWLNNLFGWRMSFWVLGGVGIAWAVFFRYWFRDRPEDMPGVNQAEIALIRGSATAQGSAHDDTHVGVPWRLMFLLPRCWAMYIAGFTISFSWYVYVTYLPTYLKDEYGVDVKESALMTALPLLVGGISCLLGGGLSDWLVRKLGNKRLGRSIVGFVGFSLAGVSTLMTAQMTGSNATPWAVVSLICVTNAIQDMTVPVIWSLASDIGQRYAGTLGGCLNMIGGIGGFLSPYCAPWIVKHWEWQGLFYVYAISYFIGATMWLFIDASKPIVGEAEPTH